MLIHGAARATLVLNNFSLNVGVGRRRDAWTWLVIPDVGGGVGQGTCKHRGVVVVVGT